MAFGAVFAWAWIPDVQEERGEQRGRVLRCLRKLPSTPLEELGEGLGRADLGNGGSVGLRNRFGAVGRKRIASTSNEA